MRFGYESSQAMRMTTREHVLLVVGWGAFALSVVFGALAMGFELPSPLQVVLIGSVMAVPTYLARSPLTPKPVGPEDDTVRLRKGPAASESGELPAAESNEALK